MVCWLGFQSVPGPLYVSHISRNVPVRPLTVLLYYFAVLLYYFTEWMPQKQGLEILVSLKVTKFSTKVREIFKRYQVALSLASVATTVVSGLTYLEWMP